MATAASVDDESRVDAELKEVERSIAELQKKRAELLRAQGAIRWAKTKSSVSKTEAPPQAAPAAPTTAPAATPASLKALDKVLSSMEWSSFKKKEGEWTFLRNRDGSLVETMVAETEFVNQLRKGKQLVVGRYRYVVSEDKFLNRYFEA